MPTLNYQETVHYRFDYTKYIPQMQADRVDLSKGEDILEWLLFKGINLFNDNYVHETSTDKPAFVED